MLEERTAFVVQKMAESLRKAALGKWFQERRYFLFVGIALSLLTVIAIARPSSRDDLDGTYFRISVMAPAAFYIVAVDSEN